MTDLNAEGVEAACIKRWPNIWSGGTDADREACRTDMREMLHTYLTALPPASEGREVTEDMVRIACDAYERAEEAVGHSVRVRFGAMDDALRAALSAPKPVDGWQPIETAPKDGTYIIAVRGSYVPCVVKWQDFEGVARFAADPEDFMEEEHFRQYFFATQYLPTHWQPLPAPPASVPQPPETGK